MCVNINKACNVLFSHSLCEVVVNSCREVQSKSFVVFRVSCCRLKFVLCCFPIKFVGESSSVIVAL